MATPLIAAKLYIPPPLPDRVARPRLLARLDEALCQAPIPDHGFAQRLTLVSAPAGFGKTTLVSEWLSGCEHPAAWLSLDPGDNDLARFLTYLIGAVHTVAPEAGADALAALSTPGPPPTDAILAGLLNEIAALPHRLILVLDDYHVIESPPVDAALAFLVEHLPPYLHLIVTSREDPPLPLARLRARGQLIELRAADLRFNSEESAAFLNQSMALALSAEDVAALEARTEGWIVGLKLAALSMRGRADASRLIASFTGSHRFVVDYLVEEVLHQQPAEVQTFLLHTSILDRLCGPLCDAVLDSAAGAGQAALEYLDGANLFLVPLDNERRWYRYHHLFGDLLKQRLMRPGDESQDIVGLHTRASAWYAMNDLEIDALQHAAAAGDIARATRLIQGTAQHSGVPLYLRGAARPVLDWLNTLPQAVLDAHPALWIAYAWSLMAAYQNSQVEEKLVAGESALASHPDGDDKRDLLGHIAALRASQSALTYDADAMITESQRALDYLNPDNGYVRAVVMRTLATAHLFRGERDAARQTYADAIAMSEASGNLFVNVLSTTGLAMIQLADMALHEAAQTYQRVLDLVGDRRQLITCVAHMDLGRIHYEWNDLDAAYELGRHGVHLAQQIEQIDSAASGALFLVEVMWARGDHDGAANRLAEIARAVEHEGHAQQIPRVAAAQALMRLRQGDVDSAAQIIAPHDLPLSQARVLLAQGNSAGALAVLTPYVHQMAARGWRDEHLKALRLAALAQHLAGELSAALDALSDVLAMAAPGGLIRSFVDEGAPMQRLLAEAAARGLMPDYVRRLLDAFPASGISPSSQPLHDPLSERELDVLRLVADGLSNREIGQRLFLALDTVKGHNRRIFNKLDVQRRTEAVARARALGLID